MKPNHIQPIASFVDKKDLGSAPITPDTTMSSDAILTDKNGNRSYLPVFQSAVQNAGGTETFATTLDPDGTLTLFLSTIRPPNITAPDVSPQTTRTSASLSYQVDQEIYTIQLQLTHKQDNIWTACATLNATQQKTLRRILLDTSPAAIVELSQELTIAVQLTSEFIKNGWSNPQIKQALLQVYGGAIGISSPEQYCRIVSQTNPDFQQQYMRIDVTYGSEIQAPPMPGYIQKTISWQNKNFSYYQDNQKQSRFYFLPETFQIAEDPSGMPSVSLLQFHTPDGTVAHMDATFRFFAIPHVEYTRIEDAKRQLQKELGLNVEMLSLQNAPGVSNTFTLNIPNDDGTASIPTLQTKAQIDLSEGLRDELNLKFKAFQALWAAIFSTAPEQTLFTGWIDVSISGKYQERIPFQGRMDATKMQEYYYKILDRSTNVKYNQDIQITTFNQVFQTQPNDNQVVAISLNFGNVTADLSPSVLEKTVTVQRDVTDIILNKADPGIYPYTMQIIRLSGRKCCKKQTTSNSVYLILEDIEQCNGNCAEN